MLCVDSEYRQHKIGRTLVNASEEWAVNKGLKMMQIELLVPTTWTTPHLTFLREWYTKQGYEYMKKENFNEMYPDFKDSMLTECELVLMTKKLALN